MRAFTHALNKNPGARRVARASLESDHDPRNRPTPNVVVEAIMLTVRERGLVALKEPATVERLKRCDAAARAEINQRIEKLGLKHAT
jgi:hypothetical protein